MSANEHRRMTLQAVAFAAADTISQQLGEGVRIILLVDVPEPAPDTRHELHFLGTVAPAESLEILRRAIAQCTDEEGECIPRSQVHTSTN